MPEETKKASAAADFKSMPLDKLEAALHTSTQGLSTEEAQKRLAQYGKNAIEEKKRNPLLGFLGYFWGPIPWMIEGALVLSGMVRHWSDFFVILLLLCSNAVVGFWEESQAGNAIAALKAKLALGATARRDGKWTNVTSENIVPGDIIHVRLGDIIPADARILDDGGDPIEVDQSSLTGESLPVTKASGDTLFSGSILRRGETDALVYATGERTFFGKTVHLVNSAHTKSHFEAAVLKIGNYLILLAVALIVLILGFAFYRGDPMLTTLEFALVLLIAAIPVAMPTVLSVTMAVGARALARKQAVVSRLTSIEELAGMDMLCSDKTGTLTQNKLTLDTPAPVQGVSAEEVILYGALASRSEDNDAIDRAVLAGVNQNELAKYQVRKFHPFDPATKRASADVIGPDGKAFHTTMGAAEAVLALAKNDPASTALNKAVEEFAKRGFRSLMVARADGEGDGANAQWKLAGVLPLSDPPREDAKETIATAEKMGVNVKMVTGDQQPIAVDIAGQLGLSNNILRASALDGGKAAAENDEEGAKGKKKKHDAPMMLATDVASIEKADGFAEVFPEHKFEIVKALQSRDHIVGMTGDGVNDAPALREANCGIAVSGATDAARAAAAIVILAPGLSVIIDAIKESRKIFQHMTSYSIYRITETLRVLLFMALAITIFNVYPVTAIMIVLLALLNDGAILSIVYDRVNYSMRPEKWRMHVVLGIATVLGVIGVVATFILFWLGKEVFHLDPNTIRTFMYLQLSVSGQLTIFLTRTRGHFYSWKNRPSWILIGAVVITQTFASSLAATGTLMPAIGWGWASFIWAYAFAWFVVNDFVKLAAYKIIDPIKKKVHVHRGASTPPTPPSADSAPATPAASAA